MTAWQDKLRWFVSQTAPGGRFWRWWQQSLLAWLPSRWRRRLGGAETRLLLYLRSDQLSVVCQRDHGLREVVNVPWPITFQEFSQVIPQSMGVMPTVWLLPQAQVLRRRMLLPAAAMSRLMTVTMYEIDRQTPFQSDQVYHGARMLTRHPDGQMTVELVVVPRRLIDGDLGIPRDWRSCLSGVDVIDERGRPLGVNLLPVHQRLRQQDPWMRWKLLLIGATIGLVVLAGMLLLDNRHNAALHLQELIQQDSERMKQLTEQRQQLFDLVDGARFFAEQRNKQPPAVAVWDALTRRLPSKTYLEKLSLEGGQMQLIGMSSEAASLVRRLEGDPLWRKPSLTGVLQSDAGPGMDRFTITAELMAAPMGKDESDDATKH